MHRCLPERDALPVLPDRDIRLIGTFVHGLLARNQGRNNGKHSSRTPPRRDNCGVTAPAVAKAVAPTTSTLQPTAANARPARRNQVRLTRPRPGPQSRRAQTAEKPRHRSASAIRLAPYRESGRSGRTIPGKSGRPPSADRLCVADECRQPACLACLAGPATAVMSVLGGSRGGRLEAPTDNMGSPPLGLCWVR